MMEEELSQNTAGESQDSAIESPPPPYHFPVSVNQQTTLLADTPPQYEEFSHTDSFIVQEQSQAQCIDLSQVIMKGMHA